jgi:hypothetical protein
MEKYWAFLDENNLVIGLYYGDINTTDGSQYGDVRALIQYDGDYSYRGVPTIGSLFDWELDKFIE